jgi:NAD(P)-dependent dehydrogenase (short-subunit alcohol dehydrogenase family)
LLHTTPLQFDYHLVNEGEITLNQHTVSIATADSVSLACVHAEPVSQWKGFSPGITGMRAIYAASLAKRGFTGSTGLFEGPNGLERAFGQSIAIDWADPSLEAVTQTVLKKYCSLIHGQPALEATLDLRRPNDLTGAEVKSVRCDIFQTGFDIGGGGSFGAKDHPRTKEQADYNLKYLIAAALLDNQVGPAQLEPSRIQAGDAQDLLARVEIHPDEDFTAAGWLLPQTTFEHDGLYLYYPRRASLAPKLRAFIGVAKKTSKSFGGIDILFANAGIQSFHPLLEMEDSDWHITIDVNLTGTANAVRTFAPYIIKRGGGRLILTSSTQGQHGTKYGASYAASKWGIIGLMKSAALELGPYNITVNALIPGLIDTALTRHEERYAQVLGDAGKQPTGSSTDEEEARKILAAKTPLGVPWIEPEDVAPVVVFLASDAARMVSGATYDVTGGDSAHNTA